MTNICKNCWTTCDVDEYVYEGELTSICCSGSVLQIDEEELEDIADEVEKFCLTFDDALEEFGDIAYYIAENMVTIPEYQGP